MIKTKPFSISKDIVQRAYLRVKVNRGSAGIDEMSLERFEDGRREHLYRLWNRMSSGSYIPLPVKLVEIPKQGGGKRPLGIPTVRISYTAVHQPSTTNRKIILKKRDVATLFQAGDGDRYPKYRTTSHSPPTQLRP